LNYIAIVPCYRQPKEYIKVINELISTDIYKVIMVDDGNVRCIDLSLLESNKIVLIRHKRNLGKGAAIKSGLKYIKEYETGEISGIVMLDCDGQHSINDMKKLIKYHKESSDKIVLGVREFSGENVPFRSKLGNNVMSFMFYLIFAVWIADTQTGLRVIPRKLIEEILNIKSDRFEFELEFLIRGIKKTDIIQVPISTIYFEKNKKTNFKPFLDSISIFYTLIRTVAVGLTAVALDYIILFALLTNELSLFYSLLVARLAGLIYSAIMVRNFVWKSNRSRLVSYTKYIMLWTVNLLFIYVILDSFSSTIKEIFLVKIFIDFILFIFNFIMQKKIFSNIDDNTNIL
jgi:hypothetical protein